MGLKLVDSKDLKGCSEDDPVWLKNLQAMALIKAKLSGEDAEKWYQLVVKIHETFEDQKVSEAKFIEFIEACGSEELVLFSREFYKFTKKDPAKRSGYDLFIKAVDESDYTLKDWVHAFFEIHQWLETEKRTARYEDVLGYLSCCVEAPEGQQVRRELLDLLKEMLSLHGFERSCMVVE